MTRAQPCSRLPPPPTHTLFFLSLLSGLNPSTVFCVCVVFLAFVCLSLDVTHHFFPYLTSYLLAFRHSLRQSGVGERGETGGMRTWGMGLLKWRQMASWVTFADIQGSAFISLLQFTLVNEIHLWRRDGLLPPSPPHPTPHSQSPSPSLCLSGCPVQRGNGKVARSFCGCSQMSRWREREREGGGKKIFNGLSVAFPALTCQVIRNLSFSLVSPSPHPPSPRSLPPPRGRDTQLITCYTNHREGKRQENRGVL